MEIPGLSGAPAFCPWLHAPDGVHMGAVSQHPSSFPSVSESPSSPSPALKVTTYLTNNLLNTLGEWVASLRILSKNVDAQPGKRAYEMKCGILFL